MQKIRGSEKISESTQERINEAIQDCLDMCRTADEPLAKLALFLAELKDAGWADGDRLAVELGVIRILQAISGTARMARDETTDEHNQMSD